MATINGTAGNDDLVGTDEADLINALRGQDMVRGGDGDDIINGGQAGTTPINDDDVLYGEGGNDTIRGGRDNDQLFGGLGDDVLNGELGVDILNGGRGSNRLDGGDGADTYVIDGRDAGNAVRAAPRSDFPFLSGLTQNASGRAALSELAALGFTVNDLAFGAGEAIRFTTFSDGPANYQTFNDRSGEFGGADFRDGVQFSELQALIERVLVSESGTVWFHDRNGSSAGLLALDFGNGHLVTIESAGPNGVEALAKTYAPGGDTPNGLWTELSLDTTGRATDGDDILIGDATANVIDGLGGDDRLSGLRGEDTIYGGEGDDEIFGGQAGTTPISDDDQLFGEGGDDIIRGGRDDDLLDGGTGDDELLGESGADELRGREGLNTLIGGEDGDTFFFDGRDAPNALRFSPGDNDRLLDFGKEADTVALMAAAGYSVGQIRDFAGSDIIRLSEMGANSVNGDYVAADVLDLVLEVNASDFGSSYFYDRTGAGNGTLGLDLGNGQVITIEANTNGIEQTLRTEFSGFVNGDWVELV